MGLLDRLHAHVDTAQDAHWRERLTPRQFRVLRRGRTERAFSGEYVHTDVDGTYRCVACDAALFASDAKFDSGSGWPSFTHPTVAANVTRRRDFSLLIPRTEVRCASCGGHLGHVFGDGPGGAERYCINSVALALEPQSATTPLRQAESEDTEPA